MNSAVVRERITEEVIKIQETKKQLDKFVKELENQEIEIYQEALVDAIALNLHGFYTGVERIFQVIANQIDYRKPTGDKWHSELLEQMSVDLPGIRQAVISENVLLILD